MSEMTSGTVTLPKLGKVKKVYFWGVLAVVGLYVGWRWYGANAGEAADVTYETGDVGDGIDASGVVGAGGASGNVQYAGTTPTDGTDADTIDTNAEWTNTAVEILANSGRDPAAVQAALGEFLAHRPLDEAEASIARAAMAVAGEPPTGGPWTIIAQVGEVSLTAPSNLRASGTTGTSTTLAYSPVNGAASYSAYRDDLGGVVVGTGVGPSIQIGGLTPNKTYRFSVAARTTTGKTGPKSSATTVKTTGARLTAPGGVRVRSERTSASVSWSPVAGAAGYTLQVAGRSGSWESTDTSDRVTGLKPGTSYRVRVAALQPGSRTPGPWSAWATGKTSK